MSFLLVCVFSLITHLLDFQFHLTHYFYFLLNRSYDINGSCVYLALHMYLSILHYICCYQRFFILSIYIYETNIYVVSVLPSIFFYDCFLISI